jgi:uncharacterized protein DUF1634
VTRSTQDAPDRLNNCLARLLGLGTWTSCGLIAAGMILPILCASARLHAQHLVSSGIVLLIVLPTVRVATMGAWFLFHRALDFALIAALVLVIIIASTLLGVGVA